MKPLDSTRAALLALLLLSVCTAPEPRQSAGECILDRNTHVEAQIHLEVPAAPRCCDELGLKSRRASAGDCELFVEEEGHGTPLVLINGGPGGTHHYFHPWFSRAAKFARVIYYDQRGCGRSDYEPGEAGYSVNQAVADLEALRQALGIRKWVLLGFSYGGFLSQYYAARHPESSAGLVLLGASPGMSTGSEPSRQHEFITAEERERMREIRSELQRRTEEEGWSQDKYMRLLVYNNHLNGDWKRQQFYRPSRERVAQQALYEWVHDPGFNSVMGQSKRQISLEGVFDRCPIPTLILEGEWDLTWSEGKRRMLHENHPGSEMVVFERAGHSIYDEAPERFFAVLERFIRSLPEVPEAEALTWGNGLHEWRRKIDSAPRDELGGYGWGRSSNEKLARAHDADLLQRLRPIHRPAQARLRALRLRALRGGAGRVPQTRSPCGRR